MKTVFSSSFRLVLFASAVVALTFSSCKKEEDDVTTEAPTFRGTKIDYNALTNTTPYNNIYFVDQNGDSTVDRRDGQDRLKMVKAINDYIRTASNAGTATLSSSTLYHMFTNTGSPFTGVYVGLNTSPLSLRGATSTSKS